MMINDLDIVQLKDGREAEVVFVYKDGEHFEIESVNEMGREDYDGPMSETVSLGAIDKVLLPYPG